MQLDDRTQKTGVVIARPAGESPIVAFDGIHKEFATATALSGVSFAVERSSIHALLGENGAGKTTLMRCLAGLLRPDAGEILVSGAKMSFENARDAKRKGIGMVHQHSTLIPSLTVLENLVLDDAAALPCRLGSEQHRRILTESKDLALGVELESPVWQLSHGERKLVEILRLLLQRCEILIMDEPTAGLSVPEAEALLNKLASLRNAGKTIFLVTHKIREIAKVADFVTILRRGKLVKTTVVDCAAIEGLASDMVGEAEGSANDSEFNGLQVRDEHNPPSGLPLILVEHLTCRGEGRRVTISNLSFSIRKGEVLGIAGVSGNGQEELAETLAGMRKPRSGCIRWNPPTPGARARPVVRYVPADRLGVGAPGELTVAETVLLRDLFEPSTRRFWLFQERRKVREVEQRLVSFGVRYGSVSQHVGTLSGGNIQRVILARELSGDFDLLIAHNPTAGLDVCGIELTRSRLSVAARSGAAVLLISEELDDLLTLCDRILVLHEGKSMGFLSHKEATRSRIGQMMAGEKGGVP